MKWNFIDSGFNTGIYNMQYDILLAKNCVPDEAYFRIYRWRPYCISLGANQSFDDIDHAKAAEDNIEIVKRPTGGRAILHAEELTYSVVMPVNYEFSPKELYQKISAALIRGLQFYHPVFKKAELENIQPNFPKLLEEPSGVLCFASTAKNEVKFDGKKLIGSAQRKLDSSILQHGSLLCGTYHQRLADYLNVEENIKQGLKNEILKKTIEVETIINESVDYDRLKECLVHGFAEEWEITVTQFAKVHSTTKL